MSTQKLNNGYEYYNRVMPFILIPILITLFLFTNKGSFWVLCVVTPLAWYLFLEAVINSYVEIEINMESVRVKVPRRKYSLLWYRAPNELVIYPDQWQALHIYNTKNRSGDGNYRRSFYFIAKNEYAFHFSTFGLDDLEKDIRLYFPEKEIKQLTQDYPYRHLKRFQEQHRDKVL